MPKHIQFQDIMIATPTHKVKEYASPHQVKSVLQSIPAGRRYSVKAVRKARNLGSDSNALINAMRWWVVVANSKEFNWRPFLNAAIECMHLNELPADHYECQGAIHRRIVTSMNVARSLFLQSDRSWFLSLEADVLLTPSIMSRIIARVQENPKLKCLYTNCYPGFIQQPVPMFTTVNRMTLGCTLIHRDIIEKFEFRFDPTMLAAFHDAFLAHDICGAGIPIYYDPAIAPAHVTSERDWSRGWDQIPSSEK